MGDIWKAFSSQSLYSQVRCNEFKWSLHSVDHSFLKGHRIMVEVQSSWFPLYDRNPQTFVPNIMTAPKVRVQGGDDDDLWLSAAPILSGVRHGEVDLVFSSQN